MAEAVVSVALETLRDLLLEEGRLLAGVGREVKALQTKLKEIKYLLKDADAKQHKSESVRNWLAEIRDLAYRAEDAILEYAVRISSDQRPRGIKLLLCRFSRVFQDCYSLHQLGSEISDIKSELARVTFNMRDYGIMSIIDGGGSSGSSGDRNWKRKTFPSFEIEDCFVGKDGDVKRLVSVLLDDQKHRVISVWGMGGIGKTTVAKKVYNQMIEAKSEGGFDLFAWVCITQQCQSRVVLEDVSKQLDPQKGEGVSSLSDTQLVEKLCEIQRGTRCLIVLDDLWEISHWNELKHAFLVRNTNSKILVTTRKQKVAEIGFSLELGLLSMEDSWELLKKKAFPHSNVLG